MFKTKRIAVALVMIAVLSALALSGCMPAATGEAGAEGGASGNLMSFIPLILIIVVFYFILIRPQNKKNKQVSEMRNALKRGDYITTIGGFRGRVVRVKDDLVTIEIGSDKTKLDIMRWGISKIEEAAPESKSSRDRDEDDKEEVVEEEQPKRRPKKLTPIAKKEPEAEDTESAAVLEEESEDEEGDKN